MRTLIVDLLRVFFGSLPRLATETAVYPGATEPILPNLRFFEIWMEMFGKLLVVR